MYKKLSSEPRPKPDWVDYFMRMTEVVKSRSPDPKTQVGAILTSENHRIISTGYNALIAGQDEKSIDWSDREGEVYPVIIHAEANCLLYAQSKFKNACLYCTLSPCRECLKLLAASGVVKVIYKDEHETTITEVRDLAKVLGITLERWEEVL
jgi:dCMP deaminase